MSSNLPLTWNNKKNSPLLADFIAKYGAEYCMTAEEINQLRDAVNEMGEIQNTTFLGVAEPADVPTGTGRGYWEVITPGPYPNHGGVVLGVDERGLISRGLAGGFKLSKVAYSFSAYAKKTDLENINVNADYKYYFVGDFLGVKGFLLNTSGIVVSTNNSYNVSPFIEINTLYEYISITSSLTSNTTAYLCFYDLNKNFISSGSRGANVPIPATAAFVRFTYGTGEFFVINTEPQHLISKLELVDNTLIAQDKVINENIGFLKRYTTDPTTVRLLDDGVVFNTMTSTVGGYVYEFDLQEPITISKITIRPSGTSVTLKIYDKITLTVLKTVVFSGLVSGSITELTTDIFVDLKYESVGIDNVFYARDNNSAYYMYAVSNRVGFLGYLAYFFDYKPIRYVSKIEVDKVNSKFLYNRGKTANKLSEILSYKNDGTQLDSFSTTFYSIVAEGLNLTSGQWNTSKNGALSTQHHTFNFNLQNTSIIQFRAGSQSSLGVIINFSNLSITDTFPGGLTTAIPSGFLVAGVNDVFMKFTTGHDSTKLVVTNALTCQSIQVILNVSNRIGAPQLGFKASDSNIILKSYTCNYPYQDIDVLFTGDSITEGVFTTAQYARVFAQKTGLKVATWGIGGGTIGVGVDACKNVAPMRPKLICAMFGANGGNSVRSFINMQDYCDEFSVPFIVHHMPTNSNASRYSEQTAILEDFILNHAHIKQSARFDISTAIGGIPANGVDLSKFGDSGVHPNDLGHQLMFNRMQMDCPLMFNLF
jgi:hypothetical protein